MVAGIVARAPSSGVVVPDREAFHALRQPVVPVTRRLLADGETPVGLYRALAAGRTGTFLLESAEHGRSWSRYSFVGVRSSATLTVRDGRPVWLGDPPPGVPREGTAMGVLRGSVEALRSPRDPSLPPLTGGLVGYLGYDAVRHFERLPDDAADDLHVPDYTMLLATDLAVLDHHDGTVLLIANAFPGDDPDAAYDDAVRRLDEMTKALRRPADASAVTMQSAVTPRPTCNRPAGGYQEAVRCAKEYIRAGDAFQIVPSQRFEMRTTATPLDVYRVLRTTNPSPYMYLLDLGDHHVVGSSPEAHVKVTGGRAMLHPIAGTRPRGATPEEDAALERELVADPKERAEHLMLVDLGRNDLGRIAASGTVDVREFMAVERYSHVIHLVSTVLCDLAPGRTAFDVLAATFPAGTLSGAPKVRAMEIIDELEPTRRGLYGGTVGYLDFAGDLDMAIAIRTALMRDGVAYVQAGGGIVADSVPDVEDQETRSKAAAVLSAVAVAETFRPA
ncbi:MAG: anthranilate synthase component I [Streptosporangiales bacterium]|nr:anthranilate synthase component I [Streptosporangiales bacterium]